VKAVADTINKTSKVAKWSALLSHKQSHDVSAEELIARRQFFSSRMQLKVLHTQVKA